MADLAHLIGSLQGLSELRQQASLRENALRQKLGAIRKRQSLQPEVQRLLEQTQQRLHQKTVGIFEELLTSLNRDVLKGDQSIRLLLEYGRGAPDLTLCAQRGTDIEDLWDGNGGALTNVVSTGLRIIALARSGLRPFLLLDEADSWCAPEIIPQFFSVFEQLADTMQLQTLFVTHHEAQLLGDKTHVLRVVPVDEKTSAVHSTPAVWDPDQPGIRWIELRNVRLHAHSRLDLGPGANALLGPNGHGKSTVASALRGVAYGEANSGLIRHGEDSCAVVLGLEHGQVLTWTRYRKASPKMRWVLNDAQGQVLHESTSAKGLPEWLDAVLAISRKEKLDIQLLHQKTPVFLLNEPGSKQASILSIGQDTEHLPELMQRYRALLQSDVQALRQGEEELDTLLRTLGATQPIPDLLRQAAHLQQTEQQLRVEKARMEAAGEFLQQWERAQTTALDLTQQSRVLQALPEFPTLYPVEDLRSLGREWTNALLWSQIPVPESPVEPAWRNTTLLTETIEAWQKWERQAEVAVPPALPDLPVLKDTLGLIELGKAWVAGLRDLEEKQQQIAELDKQIQAAEGEWAALWDGLESCPVCGQEILPVQGSFKGVPHAH